VTSWNAGAERLFGCTAREMVGQHITTIIPFERLAEEDHVLGAVRSGRMVDHFETQRRRKDGTLIDISLTVSPIRSRGGAIIGASKIAGDITEQKRLQQALRDANRAKDELVVPLSVIDELREIVRSAPCRRWILPVRQKTPAGGPFVVAPSSLCRGDRARTLGVRIAGVSWSHSHEVGIATPNGLEPSEGAKQR
jgi:PAS domain S-box-containing protein